jgi:hypothetical protein
MEYGVSAQLQMQSESRFADPIKLVLRNILAANATACRRTAETFLEAAKTWRLAIGSDELVLAYVL